MGRMMSTPTKGTISLPVARQTGTARQRLGPLNVLLLSAWCGLAGGLVEVGTRILCRSIDPENRFYMMSRHFVWLAPLSNLLLFSGLGLVVALGTRLFPRLGGWLCPRLIGLLAFLPMLIVISPRVYPQAWAILALGVSSRLVSILEGHATALRRRLILSFPGLLVVVLVSASLVFGGDWLKRRQEAGRPLPIADTPNVLLIVMDTVRADHLSVYGSERPTSPNLERLARRAIRFDEARATAPWTLASHASFFTGRWPHELGIKWMTPLTRNFQTLAEYLGSEGYATAGFVANILYCSYETGLNRGFTHYEDYVLDRFGPLRTSLLFDRTLGIVSDGGLLVSRGLDVGPFRPALESLLEPLFTIGQKKDAQSVNGEFLRWLSQRPEPHRPFFAFLNYFDAHVPYVPPRGAAYPFGLKPESQADFIFLIEQWHSIHDKERLPPRYRQLARDCYDNCIAYLDGQLGELFNELQKRGVLDQTLVIVAADHGEGLGEHGLFDHGESLYRTEIRVPLLIALPASSQRQGVVTEPVSLRDLPATVADLVGLGARSPFPGRSLARLWQVPSPGAGSAGSDGALSELPSPNPSDPNNGRSPAYRGPLVSLAEGDFVYIRNEGDGTEELFNEREDWRELSNRARTDAMQPILQRFRDRLNQTKAASPKTK